MFVFLVLHALALTDYASLSGPTGWFPGRVIVVAETPEEEAAARKNPVVDAVAPFLYDVVATNSTPFHDFAVAEGFAEGPRDYAVFSLESLTPLYQFPQTFAEILGNFTLERGLRGVFLNTLETVYNAFGRSRRAVRRVVAEVGDFLHAHGVELFVILPLDRKVFDYAQLKRAAESVDGLVVPSFNYYEASFHVSRLNAPMGFVKNVVRDYTFGREELASKVVVAVGLAGFEYCGEERRPIDAAEFGSLLPTMTNATWMEEQKEHVFVTEKGCVVTFPTPEFVTARLEYAQSMNFSVALFFTRYCHPNVFALF